MKVVIVGGGVIGLSTAFYLCQEGHDVTIIDSGPETNNCSFGNAGYISPSHFIPLASPGIVAQGLKWMLSSTSPFYIKPRLDMSLIKWGLAFWGKANEKTVRKNAPHLNNILQYSRQLTIEMDESLGGTIGLHTDGCLMLYRKESTRHHEEELAKEAKAYDINVDLLSKEQVQALEPNVKFEGLGGAFYPIDCHLHPIKLMEQLQAYTRAKGVKILYNAVVDDFVTEGRKITACKTNTETIEGDHFVIANGSWLPLLARKLGIEILLQPGKGFSVTYTDVAKNIKLPAILVDDRVAMTPLGNDLRVGGTMELSGYNHAISMNRVQPIINAANQYYTDINLKIPTADKVWAGLRPCSPDGLPYIGSSKTHKNLTIAGGHAMIGISLAAGTGQIVTDIIQGRPSSIDIDAFRVDRFS
jgi:D-amino-acid dehydrogenase